MSLLALGCAIALQVTTACHEDGPHTPFTAAALPDAELASVYGEGVPLAGMDRVGPAASSRYVDVALNSVRPSDQVREVVDNWNVAVAAPLIAQAIAEAR